MTIHVNGSCQTIGEHDTNNNHIKNTDSNTTHLLFINWGDKTRLLTIYSKLYLGLTYISFDTNNL